MQHLLSVPRTPEPASSRLLCSPLFQFVLSGLLPHPHDPPQQNKLLFTRNLGNQQGRRCELELAVASPLMVNWEAGQYVQKGVWMVSRNRGKQSNLTKGCTPHSTVHACMHAFIRSFIATHSFLRLPTQPLSQPTQPTSRWSGFSGAFSSFTPNLHVSLSSSFFPSLWQFFFYFRRKLMKIVETRTTKQNLIFFNIRQRALPLHPPKKKAAMSKTLPPPFDIHAVLRVSWGLGSDKFASL